jgi:hypothetical protein
LVRTARGDEAKATQPEIGRGIEFHGSDHTGHSFGICINGYVTKDIPRQAGRAFLSDISLSYVQSSASGSCCDDGVATASRRLARSRFWVPPTAMANF